MRISDWSSDVCSSDLYYSDRHLVRGVVDFDTYLTYAEQIDRLCADCPVFLMVPTEENFPPDGSYDEIWENERWRLLKVPPVGSNRPVDRSEEHTSELQSLMRISYAVFCLKKKSKK